MVKRILVIFIILLLAFSFIIITNPSPEQKTEEVDSFIEDSSSATDGEVDPEPEEEFSNSNEEERVAELDVIIEPVVLINPGSDSVISLNPNSKSTRGIWNRSGLPMLEDGFEGSFPGPNWHVYDNLSNSSNNYSDFWGKNTTRSKNGTYSVYCSASNATGDPEPPGNYSGNNSGYDNNMDSWMISGPYNLSDPTMLNTRLSFWYQLQTEVTADPDYDLFAWAASKNNKTYKGFGARGNQSSWKFQEYDLNDYDGSGGTLIGEEQVWFAFVFQSNDNNTVPATYNYTGVWVDDVKFENYTNLPPTKPTGLNVSGPNIRRVIAEKPVFNWTFNDPDAGPAEGPSGYHIEIGDDDNWTTIEKWTNNISGYYNPYVKYGSSNKLEDGLTYYVRVKARDADGLWSPWSDTFNFSMNDPPSLPVILSPTKNLLWEGGSLHNISWIISTNDDNGTDDIIKINFSYSSDGGLSYSDITFGEANDGNYTWTLPDTVESKQCKVKATAFDGYEETSATSAFFSIDSLPPVINNINVNSNKTWFYVPSGMNGTGGTIWFNSLPGQGEFQEIKLTLDWADVSPDYAEGALAFFDTPKDNDSTPYNLNYTIETNATDETDVNISVYDYFGRRTNATIDFLVDNDPPTAPTNVQCRPDGFTDVGEVDDDNQIYITFVEGADPGGVGISSAKLGTDDPPSQTDNSGVGQGLVTSYISNENVTIFVAMVDFVGNVGPSANDTIKIDLIPPNPPTIYSDSHPDENYYYSNPNPKFKWNWPYDLSGVIQFCVELNTISSYLPKPSYDTVMSTNSTEYWNIPDGVNFFHVRSYDRAAHWGANSSSYKLFIDTKPPRILDYSDETAMTGEKLIFSAQALDNGSGVYDKGKLFWRYADDPDFTEVELNLANDRYQTEITTDLYRSDNIEYYFEMRDLAVPSNTAVYPTTGYKFVVIIDNENPYIVWGSNDTFGNTGDPLNISIKASDNVKPDRALLYIDGWSGYYEMDEIPADLNNFTTQIVLPYNSLEPLKYYIEVYDAQNNMVRSPSFGFYRITIYDNDPPVIKSVTGDLSKDNEDSVTITVYPEDNVETTLVLTAKLYSKRNDALYSMVPVEAINGFQYIFEFSSEIKSDVDYYVLVEDTSGNGVRSPSAENEYYHIFVPAVIHPNGGEIWNTTQQIQWHAPVIPGTTYESDLSYSSDGGESWSTLKEDLSDVEIYNWDTTKLEDGHAYLLKVEIYFSNGIYCTDVTDNEFIIYNPDPPAINVEFPREGDLLKGDVTLKWTGTDPDPSDVLEVDIYFKQFSNQLNEQLNEGYKVLTENKPGTGTFIWQTLKFSDGNYSLKFVISDNVLAPVSVEVTGIGIYNPDSPMLTVLQPETNAKWTGKQKVTWIATDADAEDISISIYIRSITDENETLIASDLPNTGEYQIDFSEFKEGIYEIVVEADDGSGLDPVRSESGVFDVEHKEEVKLTTYAIIAALLIFMVVILIILFLMARSRKRTIEKTKLKKKKAEVKKKKPTPAPGMPGVGMPGMPGMPQLPGMGMDYSQQPGTPMQAGVPAEAQVPQLPAGQTGVEAGADAGIEPSPEGEAQEGVEAQAGVETAEQQEPVVEGEMKPEEVVSEPVKPQEQPKVVTGEIPVVEGEIAAGEAAAPTPVAAPKPKQKKKKKRFCGECGSSLAETDVVCVQCGKLVK